MGSRMASMAVPDGQGSMVFNILFLWIFKVLYMVFLRVIECIALRVGETSHEL